jgi:prepilin-type N-terminal cleavage/methylation domain-containing protein
MTTQRGFTLIELAIVLVIITILIGGLAVPLSAQIQARRTAETKQILEEAREAILGFAMINNGTPATNRRLPCPDIEGDGTESLDSLGTKCMQSSGFLPWVDLGVANQDAWGNRLRYEVDRDLADPNKGFAASVTNESPALTVCQTHTCVDTVAGDLAFVIVSHGPNGWGARNISGQTLALPSGNDEQDNLDNNDQSYVSRSATKADTPNGEFDDLLVWYSYPQLVAKVCPTGSDCAP